MLIKLLIKTLIVLILPVGSYAGDTAGFDRGNGGDAVICTTPDKFASIELLDWHELLNRYSYHPDNQMLANYTTAEHLELLFRKIETSYPNFGALLRQLKSDQKSSFFFIAPMAIRNVNDEGHYVLKSSNCELRQLAVNFRTPYDVTYIVNNWLYRLLPPSQQALLNLHELTYRAIAILRPLNPPQNSEDIRHLVALAASVEFYADSNQLFIQSYFNFDSNPLK
ncbi:MAG: hypothetical protein ACM3MG_14180 [Bacillota bacterium]